MGPHVFGIRHLSPAGAGYRREFLDQVNPALVLIEGPSDFTELIGELGGKDIKPPIAVMAYTQSLPIRTILYPFACYSPEYQAILWARDHGCLCRFCDLPSDVFLGMEEKREERKQKRRRNNNGQQSCLISTACKKCLIKKKTLNKEENSPSFQSLAFLSASVQQKL